MGHPIVRPGRFIFKYLRGIPLIKNENKKIEILKLLCEKYTPKYMDFFATAAIPALSKINIYEFKIYELSAKAKIL